LEGDEQGVTTGAYRMTILSFVPANRPPRWIGALAFLVALAASFIPWMLFATTRRWWACQALRQADAECLLKEFALRWLDHSRRKGAWQQADWAFEELCNRVLLWLKPPDAPLNPLRVGRSGWVRNRLNPRRLRQ
jgi:hypothetical protein